jgi:hypothetical protein
VQPGSRGTRRPVAAVVVPAAGATLPPPFAGVDGRTTLRWIVGALVVLAAGALLAQTFGGVDWRITARAIQAIGPVVSIAFVPFLGAMVLDAWGLQVLLAALGRSVSLTRLLPIRVGTEAIHVTSPAGFLVADSATASLLDARCGVPLPEGLILVVARKWLVMRGHFLYIVMGVALGGAALAAVSRRHCGGPWLPWAVGVSALAPLMMSTGMGLGFRDRPALARIQSAVAKTGWTWLRNRAVRWRDGAAILDARLARIGAARRATTLAAAAFFGCWLLESVDTAIVLRLVGGPLDWSCAVAAEVGISMIRSVGNVAPAGLGMQDAGYVTVFRAMGLSPEGAAAFVVIKRAKELLWIATGYALLAVLRRRRSPSAVCDPLGGGESAPAVRSPVPQGIG